MADDRSTRVLGFSGSLRRGSHNSSALRAARELAPVEMGGEIHENLRDIPPYDEDVRQGQGLPRPVEDLRLRARIKAADALLVATPEHNHSVPGVLKNAIGWASRPPGQPFDGKPIAIMGASPGALGTARAQYHLRQMFVFLNGMPLNRPEVMIGRANTRFDAEGRSTDEKTREFVHAPLAALKDRTERLRRWPPGAETPHRRRAGDARRRRRSGAKGIDHLPVQAGNVGTGVGSGRKSGGASHESGSAAAARARPLRAGERHR